MRRRRWLQFSLSTIFLLMTASGVWLGVVVNQARQQREAVAAIEKAGCRWVSFDYQHTSAVPRPQEPAGPRWLRKLLGDEYFQSVYSVNLENARISDDLLRHIGGQTSIRNLWLDNPDIGDRELAFLSELHNLEWISFSPSESGQTTHRISAAGLQHLRGLPHLKTLRLSQSPIGDDGLAMLGEITTLEELMFEDSQVTDAGIEHLKSLKHLKCLSFTAPQVTDAGIECLSSLMELEELGIDGTKITDRGFESLRGLVELRQLFVQTHAPGLTDAALECLAGLTKLEQLYVVPHADSNISDAGLQNLKGLPKLKSVNIPVRGITDQGIKELQRAIPGCKVN